MSRSKPVVLIERLVPLLVVLAVVSITFLTLYPFLPSILWGTMVAIAIYPRYLRLTARLGGRPMLAAWIYGLLLAVVFVIPAIGLARTLLSFLPDALNWIERQALTLPGHSPETLNNLPAVGPQIKALWDSIFSDASGLAAHFGTELKGILIWGLQEIELFGVFVFEFTIGIVLAVILVYRGEKAAYISGRFFEHVGGNFAQRMAAHAVETTRQAVRGVLGAALAQTLIATLSYVVAGVPGWPVWAGITFIFSLVQVGPVIIWLPMSIWLYMNGQTYMATFVFLWGLIIVNVTDNIVRPLLVSKDSDLPAWLAFLGALGGLMQWGVVGVFLGPVIVAVGYEMMLKWVEPETLSDETIT